MDHVRSSRTAAFGTSTIVKSLTYCASTELGSRAIGGSLAGDGLSGEEAGEVERVGGGASSEGEKNDSEGLHAAKYRLSSVE